jgi:hypothetical protein
MGITAYNRGSKVISRYCDEELAKSTAKGVAVVHPPAEPPKPPEKQNPLIPVDLRFDTPYPSVGERIYCTVSACKGWMAITEVKGHGDGLRIKTDVFGRSWGYGHNFTRKPPDWMLKS